MSTSNLQLTIIYVVAVHAPGTKQLQAIPHVVGLMLSNWKPTRRALTTMGSNDLAVAEDHLLLPSCQRYNWQMSR